MGEFQSYYWRIDDLEGADAVAARTLVERAGAPEAMAAFAHLLGSPATAGQGIALDHFAYSETTSRFGRSNLFSSFSDQVLRQARAQLSHPPVTSTAPSGTVVAGANHASALGAVRYLGDATDLPAIERALDPANDLNVIEQACMAVGCCVQAADAGAARAVGARLAKIFQHAEVVGEARVMALTAFLEHPALDQEAALLETMMRDQFPLSAYAAWVLASRDVEAYDHVLREVVGRWPDDASYPASEVRELLSSR